MAANNEKLEIPSAKTQIIRKEAIVQKLLNREKPLDKSIPQPSSVLKQVKAFMPKLKTANEQLENLDKSSIQLDGEVGEGEPYVEMNLQMYEDDYSGTSDSDSDSDSTLSPDSSSENDEDIKPSKQQRLVTEIDKSKDST